MKLIALIVALAFAFPLQPTMAAPVDAGVYAQLEVLSAKEVFVQGCPPCPPDKMCTMYCPEGSPTVEFNLLVSVVNGSSTNVSIFKDSIAVYQNFVYSPLPEIQCVIDEKGNKICPVMDTIVFPPTPVTLIQGHVPAHSTTAVAMAKVNMPTSYYAQNLVGRRFEVKMMAAPEWIDWNKDGVINADDMAYCQADVNGDGMIDNKDSSLCYGSTLYASTAVAEPLDLLDHQALEKRITTVVEKSHSSLSASIAEVKDIVLTIYSKLSYIINDAVSRLTTSITGVSNLVNSIYIKLSSLLNSTYKLVYEIYNAVVRKYPVPTPVITTNTSTTVQKIL